MSFTLSSDFSKEYNKLKEERKLTEIYSADTPGSLATKSTLSGLFPGITPINPPKYTTYKYKDEEEEDKWYNRGLFSDGYDFGDVTKSILGISDKKQLKTFTAPETTYSLEELKQKIDYLSGRTWNSKEQSEELLKLTQQFNDLTLYQYSDTLSKTKMDGQGHSVLDEIEILANMKSGKEKTERKEKVLAKMEELGMDSSFYPHFAGDGEFDWKTFGSWLSNSTMAGLNTVNKSFLQTADVLLGAPLRELGWEDNPISEGAEYYDNLYNTYRYNANLYAEKLGGNAWNFGTDTVEGTVGALPQALLMFMTGGASATASTSTLMNNAAVQTGGVLTKAGLTVETMLKDPQFWMSFTRELGANYEEAKELGASDTAASIGSVLKAFVNSGLEIGTDGGSGIQGLPDALKDGGKPFLEWIESSLEEGGEEVLQKFVGEVVNKFGYGSDEEILNPIEYAKEGTIGVLSGMALGGGQTAVQSGVNAYAEKQANKLTDIEKSVKDKIVENRIAEKETDGKKLTAKEKADIEKEVDRKLRKGYLDADEIESAIGGESYETFKAERDNFFKSDTYKNYTKDTKRIEKIEKQLKEIGEQPNTVANAKNYDAIQNRLDILKARNDKAKTTLTSEAERIMDLRNQMRSQIYEGVKDSRLAESYHELARKQQKFEVDVNQYTNENAKKTVQSILDSGLGDNSKQFHETVDFLAKISEEKGVNFNLTNNEALKGTEHYREGYTTNGFVSDDGTIVLNKDSKKALNTTVGHEITHVLEKAGAYKELASAIRDFAINKEGLEKYNERLQTAEGIYKGKKNTTAEKEVTADLIGEYLFTDYDFVNSLSTENRNIFQKIYDEIKYLYKIATAGSAEARELEKVKKVFDKAWRQSVDAKTEVNTEATIDPENDSDLDYESPVKYSVSVKDPATIDFLENQEHITTYKAMVLIDGKLYPPMATKVKNEKGKYQMTNGRELGEWMMAEEDTTNIKFNDKGVGYYVLKKDEGTPVTAAYNPYEHSSNLVLNDQFEAAYKRDNLVTVECVIPKSEMTSGYKAEYAKDAVGMMDWHSGTVASKLTDNKRSVYLSRYLKAVRIVPDSEVAQQYKDLVGDIAVPFNVVSPSLLTELENVGVNIDYEGSPQYQSQQRRAAEREAKKAITEAQNRQGLDTSSEVQYSLSRDTEFSDKAITKNMEKFLVDESVMAEAKEVRGRVADRMNEIRDKGLVGLPEDIEGNTYIANSSYDGTEENTTICPRSLASETFVDAVSEYLGRPLTVEEQIYISQDLQGRSLTPECTYCYVATDRKAYRAFLGEYIKQRDTVLEKLKSNPNADTSKNGELYQEFLNGRKDTKPMYSRFKMWVDAYKNGSPMIEASHLANINKLMGDINSEFGAELKPQIVDAMKYAQSASWAKKRVNYVAYNGHILKWKQDRINKLNQHYGLRMYSFSDFHPAFVLENMQMITDASVRGLKMLGYTKDTDFVEIFAPSGMNINISTFGFESGGNVYENNIIGAEWKKAQDLRKQHPNVGITFVATNDTLVEWALAQDWIDVVIPYHLVRTGTEVAKAFGYTNYTSESADTKKKDWKKGNDKFIAPTKHNNDFDTYFSELDANKLNPRFERFKKNPNYMKLVNECRQSASESKAVQPVFNEEAAMKALAKLETNGYYQPIGGSVDRMYEIASEVAEDMSKRLPTIEKTDGWVRNTSTQYSMTKDTKQQSYHDYLEAVNSGDTDTAQRLLDNFAKDAGYNYRGVHRSFSEFTVFDRSKIGSNAGTRLGDGFYVTLEFKDEATARYADDSYGKNRMDLYVKMDSPLILGKPIDEKIVNQMEEDFSEYGWFGEDNYSHYAVTPEKIKKIFQSNDGYEQMETIRLIANRNSMEISELLKQYGFDSVIDENSYVKQAVVFDETQLKSAEPITYDEYGDVIMPYERFSQDNMDIRYSISKNGAEQNSYGDWHIYGKDIGYTDPFAEFAPVGDNVETTDEAPIGATVAENATTEAPTEEPVTEEAPIREEPVKQTKKETSTARKLTPRERSKMMGKKPGTLAWIKEHIGDGGMVFEDVSKATNNRELEGKWNFIRNASAAANTLIGEGDKRSGVTALKSISDKAEKSGKGEKFNWYLANLHNIDRMSLAERFPGATNKAVFGDAVTAEMSRATVAEMEKQNPEFKAWEKEVQKYNGYLRDMLVDSGVITQETADLWQTMYPHYVPINRMGVDGASVSKSNKLGVNAPVKSAVGGDQEFEPILQAMAKRTLQTYKAVAKNSFGVELKNTLGSEIDTETATIDDFTDGLDMDLMLTQSGSGRNPTYTVFENGEKVTFEITEEMYEAMKPKDGTLSKKIPVLSHINSIFRGLTTQYNPVFALTNPIKDLQDVLMNSQHPGRTYANIGKAIAQMAKKGEYYDEYVRNGGKSNTYFDNETENFTKPNVAKEFLDKVFAFNDWIEMTPRLAEYITSREMGRSIEVSMLDAARVTTNFSAGGDLTKFANRNGATFLNASVQGAIQQVRNVREAHQKGLMGYVGLATRVAIAGLPTLILNNMLWDDDEEYEELADYVKQNYYVVYKNDDGTFFRIPKGRTLAVIQNAFEQVQNALTGDDEVDLGAFLKLAAENLAPNNPLDNNIIAPIRQIKNNTTWYGEDLVPSRLSKLPSEEQYDESTDALSIKLGQTDLAKKFDISPYQINYALNQYSGGIGDVFLPMMTAKAESGDDTLAGKLFAPLKDKFTTDSVLNNQIVSDFYDKSEELKTLANGKDATDMDVLKNMYISSVGYETSDLYAKKREIQNSNLSDSVKYDMVRDVQKQINELMKKAMDSYETLKINGKYATVGDKRYDYSDYSQKWYEISGEYLEKEQKAVERYGITPADYWNDQDKYYNADYYFKYSPELESVAKTVFDGKWFADYAAEVSQIKGEDKNGDGKSDSGTKKKNVFAYIDSLNVSDIEKKILRKMSYSSEKKNNKEIAKYIVGLDASYEEKKSALEALGYKVSAEGKVTW